MIVHSPPKGADANGWAENQTIEQGRELKRYVRKCDYFNDISHEEWKSYGRYYTDKFTHFDELSLKGLRSDYIRVDIKVLNSIKNASTSTAAPWFGKVGGGIQIYMDPVKDLKDSGKITFSIHF